MTLSASDDFLKAYSRNLQNPGFIKCSNARSNKCCWGLEATQKKLWFCHTEGAGIPGGATMLQEKVFKSMILMMVLAA